MYDLAFGSAICFVAMCLHHFIQSLLAKAILFTLLTLLYLWALINALHIQYFSVFVSHVNVREFFKIQQLGFDFLSSSLLSPPLLLFFVLPWMLSSTGILFMRRTFPLSDYIVIGLIGIAANIYANGESGGFSSNPKILSSYNYLYQGLHHIKSSDFSPTDEDTVNLIRFFRKPFTNEKNVWYPLLEETSNENKTGPFPNVVLLIMESIGSHCIDPETTPHLLQFQKESLYFTNYYSPIRNTASGLFSLQNSLLTPLDYIANSYEHIAYKNLPAILKEYGFSNYHFDAAEVHESQRKFYEKNGSVQSWGGNTMMQKIHNSSAPIVSDKVLYQFFLKQLTTLQQPYYAVLSPMATHGPYVLGQDHQPVYSDQVKDAYHYTDRQFGGFLAQFKTNPNFNNTLLFVTSDTSIGCFYKESTTEYDQLMAHLRVPLHIYYQGLQQPKTVDIMGSHLDLAPTLLDYLGISYQSSFLGKSLLKKPQRPKILYIKTAMRGWVDRNQCILAQTQDREMSYQCEHERITINPELKRQYNQTFRILDFLEYLNVNNRITPRKLERTSR